MYEIRRENIKESIRKRRYFYFIPNHTDFIRLIFYTA